MARFHALVLALCVGCAGCAGSFDARQIGAAPGGLKQPEVQIASGSLAHHILTNELFRIDRLWIQAEPRSEFHRWLSGGADKTMTILLTTKPERFADKKNVRILTGTLVHNTAPNESPIVHILFLLDRKLGAVSPITLQTDDQALAALFDDYDDEEVSLVLVRN